MPSLRVIPTRVGLVVALLFSATLAKADATLKWSAKQGESLKYAFTQLQEMKYTYQNQPHSNKSELTVDMTWTVKSVAADGTIEINQVADRVRVKTVSDGQIVTYDSSDKSAVSGPETELFSKIYDVMIGKSYTLHVSPQGEVVDVKVPDSVVAAVGGTPLEATADSGSFGSAKGVKNMMAQIMPKLPREPVASGTTWNNDLTLPLGPSSMIIKNTYAVTDASPLTKFAAKIVTTIDPGTNPPVTFKINKQSGAGAFTFDTEGGHLTEASIDQSSEMTLTANNMDIPQSIVLAARFKLVK